MYEFDISFLVVVRRGQVTGILTKRNFLEPIAQMERVERKLTVQFSMKDDVELDEFQRNFIRDDFLFYTTIRDDSGGRDPLRLHENSRCQP